MQQPVLAAFRTALRQGRRGRIVTPTATLSEHLRHELVRDGLVFRARDVSTLNRFVQDLAPEVQVAPGDLFHLMVEDAVRRLDLPEFQKVAGLAGFHARLAKTISDLDAAGCTHGQITGAVAAVWRDVERQMRERKLVTRGTALRIAAAGVRGLPRASDIWFEGFARVSNPERELMEALGVAVPETPEKTAARTLVLVPETAEREVEEIARRVLDSGSLRDIGVVVRKPEKYVPLLRAAFQRFGIPAHFYFKEPLSAHPAARLFTGMVDALLNGWEHEQFLEVLRSIPGIGVSDALDEFIIDVRESLPGRGLEALLEIAGPRPVRRILKKFEQLAAWGGERRTPDEWAARLNHLPSFFGPGRVGDHMALEEAERARFEAAGVKAFAEAMESAASWWIDKSESVDLEQFWHVARSVIRLGTFELGAWSRNVVHVMSPWEARQWDLGTVFVCGMVEKDFPAQHARDPFFPDAVLRAIGARTSQDKDDEERGLFDEVCRSARDLVVLSYPRTDARGQCNLKSIFLNGMEAEGGGKVVRPALRASIAQWLQPSRITSRDLLDLLSEKHAKTSVTALESLLQCPFQFFASKTLRTEELPCHPEDRLNFLVQGNIAHQVLREWFRTREELEPLFARVFASACVENNIQPGYRTDRIRRLILMTLRNFTTNTQYPAPVKPLTEQRFELAVDGHFRISGTLDRIDELEDGRAVVVDYKFSNANSTRKRIDDETKLQGPLYAWAVEKQFGREAAAMVYVSLKGGEQPKYFGWGSVPGAALKGLVEIPSDWITKALERASNAAKEFRLGTIHPRPAAVEPCRYCNYRDACRIEQPVSLPEALPAAAGS